MNESRWYDNEYSEDTLKWVVHKTASWWCAHDAATGKRSVSLDSWREAYSYAISYATIDIIDEKVFG